MKSNMNSEPSLDKIDDYNNKESQSKRNTVRLVIVFCLLVAGTFAYLKFTNLPDDYIGTKEAPGIDVSKK